MSDSEEGGLSRLPSGFVANPRGYIMTVVVGLIIGLFTAVLQVWIDVGAAIAGAFRDAGDAFAGAFGDVGVLLVDLVARPFGALEVAAAAAGPFAPVFVAVVWAVTAAVVAAILYTAWRLFTWI